ncbi:MAG: hypothetical protein ABS61_03445 [Microbacterium sp. SCN 70-18]|nr:MAG: hypothetical protein ABS61_03445 [Microbacterium sp. SCN 70-18]
MHAVVTQKLEIAPRVVEIALRPAEGDFPSWEPGAHIDVQLPGMSRQYSLVSDPSDTSEYRIAVLREEHGGGGSAYLHDTLMVGDEVQFTGPRNHFALQDASHHILLAAGIGITPILAMAEALRARSMSFSVVYTSRDPGGMPYRERVQRLPDARLHFSGESGRLDVASIVSQIPPGGRVYCCGPGGFIDAARDAAAGMPPDTVIYEKFQADEPVGPRAGDSAIEVECVRMGKTIRVGPEESILDALNRAGAGIERDCGEGICGTCEVKVIEGDIDHRDEVLLDSEKDAGDVMLVCCSRVRGGRLVLDI